jgi:hypothetical protein
MTRLAFALCLTTFLTTQTQLPVEITAEPHHHQTFANADVRAFTAELPPHAETLMHWHRHDYIYVTLGDSEVVNTIQGKDPVTVKLQDGQTGFLPGNFAHQARNLRDQPFRIVNIELLQDENLRASSAKWDEDRGLDILHGGTKEILFVKDTVRVSEIELQPDGVVPSVSRSGPVLLVAINDLDLFTNDPRTHGGHEPNPTAPSHLSSGDTLWLPVGFQRPIINAGHHPAKFITLEFH